MDLSELLGFAVKNGASDIHVATGLPPLIRVDGEMRRMEVDSLTGEVVLDMISGIMSDLNRKEFEERWECDFAFEIPNVARFRVNAFTQARGPAAAFRVVPTEVLSLDQINAPPVFAELAKRPKGLVLVTGPTGSGKSTTLAAMIDYVNEHKQDHILTLEDPIEFVHPSKSCLVNQREVGRHTKSFAAALKSALREDPDAILVGEMRDMETISLALTAAETGHLVFGTLHTSSAAKTIDRIIDVFPSDQQGMVRAMLSESVEGIIAQRLLKKIGGGRCAAYEILLGTHAIRNLIREAKVPQIYGMMEVGQKFGMITMEKSLQQLVAQQMISPEAAQAFSDVAG